MISLRTSQLFRTLIIMAICGRSLSALGQKPSRETLTLSLRTVSKALAACNVAYTRVEPGTSKPILKMVVDGEGYRKDMESLQESERIANFLVSHPEEISGRALVAILSTSDDLQVGVGATQTEILRKLVQKDSKISGQVASELVPLATSLDDCQRSLFNAGDDYVGLVLEFVGAEDDAVAKKGAER